MSPQTARDADRFSSAGAFGGSQAPVGSGAVRASGKWASVGASPGTNAESQMGSLPHSVTYFLYGAPAGAVSGSSANPFGGRTTPSISP